MSLQHRGRSWFDSSQVFADTNRIDLFDDPPWNTAVRPRPRKNNSQEARPSWRSMVKRVAFGHSLGKRGQHSHKST